MLITMTAVFLASQQSSLSLVLCRVISTVDTCSVAKCTHEVRIHLSFCSDLLYREVKAASGGSLEKKGGGKHDSVAWSPQQSCHGDLLLPG